jgi:hypothetical protein
MRRHPVLLSLALLSAACVPDDVPGAGKADTGATGDDGDGADGSGGGAGDGASGDGASGGDGGGSHPLAGTWVSEGADLSDLFRTAFFDYKRIEATFEAGGDYAVRVELNDGQRVDLAGTWSDDRGSDPAAITLEQVSPEPFTSAGIYAISGDTLTYEIATIAPDIGCVPPTPESGFGTTQCPNLAAGANVQTYRRD